MNQHLDKMALKIVKVAILVISAIDLANGQNCNSSRNSDVLETAFGQVIDSRLENQTMIMLDQIQEQNTILHMQNEKLDFMMKTILDNQDIIIRKQNEAYERNLEELKSTSEGNCKELLDAKLQEQSDYFQANFEEQNETHKQNLEELESLQEQYKTILQQMVHLSIQQNNESEWVRIVNSDIWLSSETANFDDASEICDGMDARLYEPQSLLHNNLVFSLIEARGRDHKYHFIGIHDKHEEGT